MLHVEFYDTFDQGSELLSDVKGKEDDRDPFNISFKLFDVEGTLFASLPGQER